MDTSTSGERAVCENSLPRWTNADEIAALTDDDLVSAFLATEDGWLEAYADEIEAVRWRTVLVDGTYDDWKADRLADDHQADISPTAFAEWEIDDAVSRAEALADQ